MADFTYLRLETISTRLAECPRCVESLRASLSSLGVYVHVLHISPSHRKVVQCYKSCPSTCTKRGSELRMQDAFSNGRRNESVGSLCYLELISGNNRRTPSDRGWNSFRGIVSSDCEMLAALFRRNSSRMTACGCLQSFDSTVDRRKSYETFITKPDIGFLLIPFRFPVPHVSNG